MSLLGRRQFLVASSATAGAVLFAGCVPPQREGQLESRVLMAEDLLSAYDNWYATTCRGCAAGCGAVLRVVDGRARKAEGNPDHPVNSGKLCARGQAIVQEQYHPDRLRGPLWRDPAGPPGAALQPIDWARGVDLLATRLGELRAAGRAADVTLITPPLTGSAAIVVESFARAYGLKWMPFETLGEAPLVEAARRVFAVEGLPRFDVQNARMVLSFGADFLSGWVSPVHYSVEYGVFRQGRYEPRDFQPRRADRPRGRLVHVESHFSSTAANADEWVWVRPGGEGLLALSLAHALVTEHGIAWPGGAGLDVYAAAQTAGRTGVAPERVRRLAGELADLRPSLVLGGGSAGAHTNGTDSLSAILGLNLLLDNLGRAGGVIPSPESPFADAAPPAPAAGIGQWHELIQRMAAGQEQAVLVLGGANPAYGLPGAMGFADALARVPFVVSFGSFADETTQAAHLVLPAHLPLEDWGDDVAPAGAAVPLVSLQQPVVRPVFDTRSAFDVVLALAEALGGAVADALPWRTYRDLVAERVVRRLQPLGRGSVIESQPERFWMLLLQHGGWWDNPPPSIPSLAGPATQQPPLQAEPQLVSLGEPELAGDAADFPFFLVVSPHNTLGVGESAHLPWLQAAPDPLTSVTWQTWVELNPRVAAQMRLVEGDVVRVESPYGSTEAPVYVSLAAAPEVVSLPLGQGHVGYGRWANGRGANPLSLLAPLADSTTGALAHAATRVRLVRTGRHVPLPKLEGSAPVRQLPENEVVEVTRD